MGFDAFAEIGTLLVGAGALMGVTMYLLNNFQDQRVRVPVQRNKTEETK